MTLDKQIFIACRDNYSLPLVNDVLGFLRQWGFSPSVVNPKDFRSKEDPPVSAFLDYELLSNMPLATLSQLSNQPVILIHQTRVYDSTMRILASKMNDLAKSNLVTLQGGNPLSTLVEDKLLELIDISERIKELSVPHKLIPAASGMMGSHPDFLLEMAYDTIEKIKFAGGYPYLLQPKTSREWSHKAPYYLSSKNQHEAFLLKHMMANFVMNGLEGWAVVHPHAEEEGLFFADAFGLPIYASINPQNGCRVNGIEVDLASILPDCILSNNLYNPFGCHLSENYSSEHTLIMSPDGGALENTYRFTRDRASGFRMIGSKGCRKKEGEKIYLGELTLEETRVLGHKFSREIYVDSLEEYLSGLHNVGDDSAGITVPIVDDKNNTMNTANGAAIDLHKRVQRYNEENETNYSLSVELWVTHMRTPDLEIARSKLAEGYIKKIVCLDTVCYIPPLEELIKAYDLEGKIQVIPAAAYQSAIASVMLNALHRGEYQDAQVQESISKRRETNALLRVPFDLAPSYGKWG